MSARSSQSGDQGFAERLSPLIARVGVVAVPALLLKYQGRLGLTDGELVYLLHVLDHKRDGAWPWVAVGDVAAAMRRDERNVRSRKESLRAKGYLICRAQRTPHGDRGADEHDLSGLFAELERLAIEDRTAKALNQVREDLPPPTYCNDEIKVTRTPAQRLAVRRRRVVEQPSADLAAVPPRHAYDTRGGGENAPTLPAKTSSRWGRNRPHPPGENAPTSPAKSPGQSEDCKQTSDQMSSDVRTDETGLAAAARPPGHPASSPNQGEKEGGADDVIETETPGSQDDGICLYIEQWATELGDDDPQRSLEQAHHLWWNSKLERYRFHNAMKAALHATQVRHDAGKLHGPPIRYFFAALRTTASEQCRKAGLPPLKETREEQRERMALSGIPEADLELAAQLDELKSDDQAAAEAAAPRRRRERVVA